MTTRSNGLVKALCSAGVLLALCTTGSKASAQTDAPVTPDKTWGGVTDVTAIAAVGAALITPRLFYPAPEVTVGWKARWHYSQLASVMTLTTLALSSEKALGADAPSTHSFVAGSMIGHGIGVFMVDTFKWSDGRVSGISVATNLALPIVLGGITMVGRAQGNYETTGKVLEGGLIGLGAGVLLGVLYAEMARPECGYSGSLVCW